jgi:hypothetical protein
MCNSRLNKKNNDMKALEIDYLETIEGGDFITGVCAGIGAGATVYGVGVALNWWNPVGWGGGLAMAVVGGACVTYTVIKYT